MHKEHWRNGQRLVSVTELTGIISKPFLSKWQESLCEPTQQMCGFVRAKQVAEEAAELGNNVHEDVAQCIASNYSYVPQTEWGKKINLKLQELGAKKYLIEPESTLIDEESGLAGSPDAIIEIQGKPYIFDIKIKNQLDANTDDQGSGYRYLMKRKFGVDIPFMLILWAQKKTVKQTVKDVLLNLDKNTEAWKALVLRWNKANPKRRVVIHE